MARRRRKSRGKKIFLIILAVLIVLVLAIVGVGAKLYLDLSHSIEKTYESVERTQGERTKPVDLDKQESFSVLLMGIDTGDLGRVDQGRSDTIMVATVSPEDKQTTIVSIPRDTYVVIGMFVTTMIIQASNNSISPIISLYIRQLLHGHGNVTLISGIIASIPGIATLIAAPRFGRLGDKIGSERILAIGLGFAILVYIPMAFVTNVWQLAALRFLIGISDACLLPAVQALITKYSPHQAAGRIFSYNQSFQATGNVVGPMIGSSVSSAFGYRGVFLSTSLLVLVNFLLVRHNTQEIHQQETAEEKASGVSIASGHSPSHRQ